HKQRAERDQHNQPEIGERETDGQAETGQDARLAPCPHSRRQANRDHRGSLAGLIDLVEYAAIGEVLLLRVAPAAKGVDTDQLNRRLREDAARWYHYLKTLLRHFADREERVVFPRD